MKMWLYPLWVIIDLLILLMALTLWVTAPEYTTLNLSLTIFSVSLGLILLFIRWRDFLTYIRSRYFKHVLYHGLNVFLIVSILGLVNYLGFKNYKEFDLTKESRNTLTGQSLQILKMIKSPLAMTLFARREEWHMMLNLLKLYEAQNKQITITAIDTDVRPDLVQEKSINQNGTVVISYAGKETSFVLRDELSVTNALLKSLRNEDIIMYNVQGHQELSCDDSGQEGMSFLCQKLSTQNYVVKNLDLTRIQAVPSDATALMVLGPKTGFLPQELKLIEDYLNRGGSLFLAIAPAFKAELYDNLKKLTEDFGLKIGNDIVIDRLSTVQGAEATVPIVQNYEAGAGHPITQGLNLRTVFPLSSSIRTIPGGNDSSQILAATSHFPGSWAETDLKGITTGKAQFNEGVDTKGPVGLLGVGERVGKDAPKDSRLVALGSSSFLINAYQGQSGNSTLFLNAVSWLINDEGIISLNRPGVEEEPVILSAQHIYMIFIISILLVPLIFFGTAIFIYRRRRLL